MELNPFEKYADLFHPGMEIEEMAEMALKALEEAGLDSPEVREVVKEILDVGTEMREEIKGLSADAATFKFHMEHKEKIDEGFAKLHKVTMKTFEAQRGR